MSTVPHVVRRQTLELTVPAQEGASALQDEVRRLCQERLVPILDRVLTRCSSGHELVRLDRVELDLGVLTPDRLAEELTARAEAALEKALSDRVESLRRDPSATADGRLLSAEMARLRWLRIFLDTGHMPWWAPKSAAADPAQALAGLLETAPSLVVQALRDVGGPRVARRVVRQLAPPLRDRILDVLIEDRPELQETVDDWRRLLGEPMPESLADEPRRPAFVADQLLPSLLARPAEEVTPDMVSRRLTEAIHGLSPWLSGVVRLLEAVARRVLARERPLRGWLESRARRLEEQDSASGPKPQTETQPDSVSALSPAEPSLEEAAQPTTHKAPSQRAEPPQGTSDPHRPQPQPKVKTKQSPPTPTSSDPSAPSAPSAPSDSSTLAELLTEEEALFVDDAGLVLLTPFLPAFFEKVGLVAERSFVSDEARERAVHLLRYLATGATTEADTEAATHTAAHVEASEHLLTLDKLLCGWPLEEPLRRGLELTAQEVEESHELLLSVIEHWKALGDTSPDGLRGSFLIREGRLTTAQGGFHPEGGWRLTVTRTGFDVLLDQLPWGISLVLNPFMERPLYVEW